MNSTFIEVSGFQDLYPEVASHAETVLKTVLEVTGTKGISLIGGSAVVLHTDKSSRAISSDIDFLVSPALLNTIKKKFYSLLKPNRFGMSLYSNGVDIDFLAAMKPFDKDCLESSKAMTFKNFKVPVIDISHLIVKKFLSGRDKDLKDMSLLTRKASKEEIEKSIRLMKKYYPNEEQDFSSELLLIKHGG